MRTSFGGRRALLVGIIVASATIPGCFSFGSNSDSGGCSSRSDIRTSDPGCWFFCFEETCPAPAVPPSGPRHGLRTDGRVDVTAEEAWPNRPDSAPLTKQEIADGCAAWAACGLMASTGESLRGAESYIQYLCTSGAAQAFATSVAERVIPINGRNESFEFLLRGAIEHAGDCDAISGLLTPDETGISCQEDGCFMTATKTVSCEGDVAVVDGKRRDCSRSGMRCSTDSPTGCTDRPLTLCDSPAKDRCDGTVKLGCDGCGFVSYHDCSWNGGRCVETEDGAECQDPVDAPGCKEISGTCNQSTFSLCVAGTPVTVDCGALGGSSCQSAIPATEDGGTLFESAFCVPPEHPIRQDGGAPAGDAGR